MPQRSKGSSGSGWTSAARRCCGRCHDDSLACCLHRPEVTLNRNLVIASLVVIAAACRPSSRAENPKPQTKAQMQTIDSGDVRPSRIDAPPGLNDEAPPAKTGTKLAAADAPP